MATNRFYTAEDIRNFEQRITERAGKPTGLELVQSLSDVGEGKVIREMLARYPGGAAAGEENLSNRIDELQSAFESRMRAVALPTSISLLSAAAELARGPQDPALRLVYLAEAPMAESTRTLLAEVLGIRIPAASL